MTRRAPLAVGRAHPRWRRTLFVLFLTSLVASVLNALGREAAAQAIWFERVPPDPAPGGMAEVSVAMAGYWGYREECGEWADFTGCTYTWYDNQITPESFTFRVNGVATSLPLSVGPVQCQPAGVSTLAEQCWQESHAAGTISFPVGTRVTLDAAVTRTADNRSVSTSHAFTSAPTARAAPLISLAPYEGAVRDVGRCMASCFEVVAAVATPAYTSRDVPRSAALVYRSGQAVPVPTVTLDVVDPSLDAAAQHSLKLLRADGARVTFLNGATELFFTRATPPAGLPAATRLVGAFDAHDLATGAYIYTAEVTSRWADGTVRSAQTPVRVLVVNERGSHFGLGWSMPGPGRIVRAADGGVLLVPGDGSAAYFGPPACDGCPYQPPPGDFSQLVERIEWSAWRGHHIWVFRRTLPGGASDMYLRDAGGIQESASDRLGNTTWYGYDFGPRGFRMRWHTDPTRHTGYELTYDAAGYVATIEDRLGRRSRVEVDAASGYLRAFIDPAGRRREFRYQPHGALETEVQPDRGEWTYAYDVLGRLSTATAPAIRTAAGATVRPVARTRSPESDLLTGLGAGRGGQGAPLPGVYPSNAAATLTDPAGLVAHYWLDRFGQVTNAHTPGGRVTLVWRDQATGAPVREIDPNGREVRTFYNLLKPYLVDSLHDAAAGVGTAYAYDAANGDAVAQVRVNGRETQAFTYANGRVATARAGGPGQPVTRYRYLRAWDARPDSAVDGGGHATAYAYEAGGLQNLQTTSAAETKTTVVRDAFGRPWISVDPLGRQTRTEYDALNRVVRVTGPDGAVTRTDYDDARGTVTVTDAVGQQYVDSANALGVVAAARDPAGAQVRTVYDAAGRVAQTTNRRGQAVTFGYDPATGALASLAASDGAWARYAADPLGRWAAAENAEARDTVYADALGRDTLAVRRFAALPGLRYLVRAAYDSLGRRTARRLAREGARADSRPFMAHDALYRYDRDHGQLASVDVARGDFTWGANVNFGYNDERTQVRTGFGNTGVSAMLRPTGMHTLGAQRYVLAGRVGWNAVDDAFGHVFSYDSAGRAAMRIAPRTLLAREYTYDPAGRLRGDTLKQAQPQCPATSPPAWSPGDAPYNLRGPCGGGAPAAGPLAPTAFGWDRVGNPVRPDVYVLPQSGNRMAWAYGQNHNYDADGNLAYSQLPQPDGRVVRRLHWDALGRLAGAWADDASAPGGHIRDSVTFGYDAAGRRAHKASANTGVTRYLWDGDELLAELDGAGNLVAHYTHDPRAADAPLAVSAFDEAGASRTFYYLREAPGHVVGLLDEAGNVAARYAEHGYPAFGAGSAAGPVVGRWRNPLQYGGREYDAETGLYYQRARYYDPRLGRFVSQDPIGLAGGINLYAYAGNDPVNRTDPTGLSSDCRLVPVYRTIRTIVTIGGVGRSGEVVESQTTEIESYRYVCTTAAPGTPTAPPLPAGLGGGRGGGGAPPAPAPTAPGNSSRPPSGAFTEAQVAEIFRGVGQRVKPLDDYGKCFAGSVLPNAFVSGGIAGTLGFMDATAVPASAMRTAGGATRVYATATRAFGAAAFREAFSTVGIITTAGTALTCAATGRDLTGTVGKLFGIP